MAYHQSHKESENHAHVEFYFRRRNRIMDCNRTLRLLISTIRFGIALSALIILIVVGAALTVRAQNTPAEKVIYNFKPATGYFPTGVIRDAAGNLYVATDEGGSNGSCVRGCGNILKVSPTGGPTPLYTFEPGAPKSGPGPTGLIRDSTGILYGATASGGHFLGGSIFKLAPSGVEKTIYNFDPSTGDGYFPDSAMTMDSAGNLYGATQFGGGTNGGGYGTIYKVTRSGSETLLYSFTGGSDGSTPFASPIFDAVGDLYGTSSGGGDLNCSINPGYGCGTVWKLDTSGNFTVLYTFTGGTDGASPAAGLVMDPSGNLYGDANVGGDLSCDPPIGCGTVFKIDSLGNFTVLYVFTGGSNDGEGPIATLLRDSAGNLYGTTYTGGDQSCTNSFGNPGCGVVFKLDGSGNETILHVFAGGTTDGALPESTLISDGKGNLYGTTTYGGVANGGVIFVVQAY
jgi:uncharacterized repeat protein (TIGR03803 family)